MKVVRGFLAGICVVCSNACTKDGSAPGTGDAGQGDQGGDSKADVGRPEDLIADAGAEDSGPEEDGARDASPADLDPGDVSEDPNLQALESGGIVVMTVGPSGGPPYAILRDRSQALYSLEVTRFPAGHPDDHCELIETRLVSGSERPLLSEEIEILFEDVPGDGRRVWHSLRHESDGEYELYRTSEEWPFDQEVELHIVPSLDSLSILETRAVVRIGWAETPLFLGGATPGSAIDLGQDVALSWYWLGTEASPSQFIAEIRDRRRQVVLRCITIAGPAGGDLLIPAAAGLAFRAASPEPPIVLDFHYDIETVISTETFSGLPLLMHFIVRAGDLFNRVQ